MSKTETLTLVVKKREAEAQGILALYLESPDGAILPSFEAGSHIDVHLSNGMVRQYSLCGDPSDQTYYRIGVLLDERSRGGSQAVHRDLLEGSKVRVSKPKNFFSLDLGAKHSILIAGGIGVTPLLAMAYQLRSERKSFEFHYKARSQRHLAFLPELLNMTSHHCLSSYVDDDLDNGFDIKKILNQADQETHLYVCGPKGFIDWIRQEAELVGLGSSHIHSEYFQSEADGTGKSFEVVALESKLSVKVREDQSIIEALSEAGISVPISCEQGICGTCLCDVVDGVPDHRDVFLTDKEKEQNKKILVCCSRSLTDTLVLAI